MSNLQNTQPEGFNRQTQIPTQTHPVPLHQNESHLPHHNENHHLPQSHHSESHHLPQSHHTESHIPHTVQQGIDKVSSVVLGKQPIIEERPMVVGQQPITRTEKIVIGQQPIIEQKNIVVGQQPIIEQRPVVVGHQPIYEQKDIVVGQRPIMGEKDVVVGQKPIIEQRPAIIGEKILIEQRHQQPIFDHNLTTHLHHHQHPTTTTTTSTIPTTTTTPIHHTQPPTSTLKTPHHHEGVGIFTQGARLALLSSKDKYLTFKKDKIKHSRSRGEREVWCVESCGNNLFALRNECDGRYLSCCDNKLRLHDSKTDTEMWRIERIEHDGAWRYLLTSQGGDFLSEGLLHLKLKDGLSSKTYWDAQTI